MSNAKPTFYLMYRGWLDHPALGGAREPHNRRSAWAWLIENAAWRDTKIDVNGTPAAVQRGQISVSFRTLAREWNWSLAVVQRFIDRLKTDTLIETTTDTGRLLITICNYTKYQENRGGGGTPSDTGDDTGAVQERYTSGTQKKQDNNITLERRDPSDLSPAKEIANPAPQLPGLTGEVVAFPSASDNGFDAWYARYPKKSGKLAAKEAYRRAIKRGATSELLLAAVVGQTWNANPKYRPDPATWLNQGRWLDEQNAPLHPDIATVVAPQTKQEGLDEMARMTLAYMDSQQRSAQQ